MASSFASQFDHARVVVSTVNKETAISSVWLDVERKAYEVGRARIYNLWQSNQIPADNNDDKDHTTQTPEIVNPHGTAVRLIELPPGYAGHMHRTMSLDYGLVLKGAIALELDDGTTTEISEGSLIVQRGATHKWLNNSSDWVRVVFVLIPAEKVKTEAGELGEDTSMALSVD